MSLISKIWYWIPATYRLIVAGAIVLVVILIVWFYGAKAANRIGSWWHNREVQELKKTNQSQLDEINKLKLDKLRLQVEYDAEKKLREGIQAERKQLEKVLADQTATTNGKLAALRKLLAQPTPTSPPDISDEELCRRAAANGIPCTAN